MYIRSYIGFRLNNYSLALKWYVYCTQLHNNLQVTIRYNHTIRIRQCGCIDEGNISTKVFYTAFKLIYIRGHGIGLDFKTFKVAHACTR